MVKASFVIVAPSFFLIRSLCWCTYPAGTRIGESVGTILAVKFFIIINVEVSGTILGLRALLYLEIKSKSEHPVTRYIQELVQRFTCCAEHHCISCGDIVEKVPCKQTSGEARLCVGTSDSVPSCQVRGLVGTYPSLESS
jgi:hypothetical protein